MLGKAEEAERKAHAFRSIPRRCHHPKKGLGASGWLECLEFSECGGGGGGGVLEQE